MRNVNVLSCVLVSLSLSLRALLAHQRESTAKTANLQRKLSTHTHTHICGRVGVGVANGIK